MAFLNPLITEWVNYEIRFDRTEDKIRFLLHLENWIRKWKGEALVESFHVKHHRSPRNIRVRLLPVDSKYQALREKMKTCLLEYDQEIVNYSNEIGKEQEDMSGHDYIRWKILEYNTEILFLLLKNYGIDYKRQLKEKYLTGKFDMIHLLLNQLGLPEMENLGEIRKLYLWYEEQLRPQ